MTDRDRHERALLFLSAMLGFSGVALGAFGAHGLRTALEGIEDEGRRLEWWTTAAHYHLVHAIAVAIAGLLAARRTNAFARAAGLCHGAGVLVFSGTLYAMALGAPRWLGAVTPLGGVTLLVGWVLLGIAAVRP